MVRSSRFDTRRTRTRSARARLGPLLGRAARQSGSDALAFLADAFSGLPRPTATDRASVRRRHRDKAVLREQLRRLLEDDPFAATAIDQTVADMNADPDALHALLDMQNYRLAWWRSADRDLGLPALLRHRHAHRIADGGRAGLPGHPSAACSNGCAKACSTACASITRTACAIRRSTSTVCAQRPRTPGSWPRRSSSLDEHAARDLADRGNDGIRLPESRDGSVRRPGRRRATDRVLPRVHRRDTRLLRCSSATRSVLVLREVLGSDVNRLTDLLLQICERHRRHRDYSRHQLTDALRELIAWFPVYRTYVQPYSGQAVRESTGSTSSGGVTRRCGAARHRGHAFRVPARPAVAGRHGGSREGVRRPLPATDRPGHGQRRRGHGLLHLQPLHRAQRSRRRSLTVRDEPRAVPRGGARRRSSGGRSRCWQRPRTTPSAAKMSGPASRCSPSSRRRGSRPSDAGRR